MARQKKLNDKQRKAIELLTCGEGLLYKDICDKLSIDQKTLYRWMYEPEFAHFQAELERIENIKWDCLVDLARASARRLIESDNARIVEYVLKCSGKNPVEKSEVNLNTDIVINIDGDEE